MRIAGRHDDVTRLVKRNRKAGPDKVIVVHEHDHHG
jgi:hypothetical protein